MAKNIIVGQKIDKEKLQRARELRKRMTPEEKILWARLRANRFSSSRFRRQQVIDGFIVDFYCHESGLVVEVDGEAHDAQKEYDAGREKVLSERNLRVLRFKNREIRENLGEVLSKIAEMTSPPAPLSGAERGKDDLTPLVPLSDAERGKEKK
jgi:very-short-patch-repair endonuclease